MSTEAVDWAMDKAPMPRTEKGKPDTTGRHVLQVLAEYANPAGANSHPSVLRIQFRTGYDRTTVQRALRRLEKAGLIRRDGSVDSRTRWQLAMEMVRPASDWTDLEREENEYRAAAAERKRRSRSKGVTGAESVTVTNSKPVTVTDAESVTGDVTDSAPSRHALNAQPSRTQRRPNHQQPSVNQLHKDSSSPPAQQDTAAAPEEAKPASKPRAAKPTQDEHLDAFGAFWLNYPKKKAREEAKKAWVAALKRGADPERMVTAAAEYARERVGQEAQYTKHPATWLNKGCYDDEPDPAGRPQLRALPGRGHIPHQDHQDHEIYHQGWGS
ncbi:helix-turn-helix domain-containing protein [Streptomyces cyaneofuscatus]|uniref:helix-turn-helix domain-containing protein n=1 Tax=Streptomyces cyaneofuscatus TaxID=66883 RepID=UPI00367C93EC